MSKIKTRKVEKDIKVLDKSFKTVSKAKNGYEKIKSNISNNSEDNNVDNPTIYAQQKTKEMTKGVVNRQVEHTYRSVRKLPQNIDRLKEMREEDKKRREIKKARKELHEKKKDFKGNHQKKTIKGKKASIKDNSTTNRIKTADSEIRKTASQSKQTSVNFFRKKRVDQLQKSRFMDKVRNTTKTVKNITKNVVKAIKRMMEYTRLLISCLFAGGSVVITVIIIMTMLGMLVSSPFGIFFSNDKASNDNDMTLSEAIVEINAEFSNELATIRNNNSYDEINMTGSKAKWKDVLIIYSIKTVNDEEIDVVTIDDKRLKILKDIFWEMNVIEHSLETVTKDEIVISDDGNGNRVEDTETVTKAILTISISGKSVEEISKQYSFNEEQLEQLSELMSAEYNDMWNELVYGILGDGNEALVQMALSQVGNIGGGPYWSWYGFDSRVEWCAIFVSWCANELGYIEQGIFPRFASCQNEGVKWFKDHGLWQDNGYIPKAGDIIFFDWEGDGSADHVGVVENVDEERVYTIEGNSNDECGQRDYRLDSIEILGYGIANY